LGTAARAGHSLRLVDDNVKAGSESPGFFAFHIPFPFSSCKKKYFVKSASQAF
jgi:hypothetical protein